MTLSRLLARKNGTFLHLEPPYYYNYNISHTYINVHLNSPLFERKFAASEHHCFQTHAFT